MIASYVTHAAALDVYGSDILPFHSLRGKKATAEAHKDKDSCVIRSYLCVSL
jgi:hypothetical protein